MAGKSDRVKEPLDFVHQNAILCETISKELRCQKLCTTFSVNPFRKTHTLSGKPMSWHDHIEEKEDPNFLNIIHHAALEPTKKYTMPQTESQEIGWITTPLVTPDRTDIRLHNPRRHTEITKYMDAAWRLKEQTENM
ncbi:protein FAM183A isoform X1 [Protopterus annectens]|uniref:protein FAM183A isoform X1 n=1 Tax=Protopterus annectens TaxID=7888 RepID=UPI001CF9FD3C|nr:protein FAM183A isoform X1 [Protopterus annectens]